MQGDEKGFFFKTITDGRCRRADEMTLKWRGAGISLIIHAFLCLTSEHLPSQKPAKELRAQSLKALSCRNLKVREARRQRQHCLQFLCELMIALRW